MGLKRQLRRLAVFPLRHRGILGLFILLVASYLGNLARWNLFFNIDLIFGSVAVWLVVCFYGIRWGVLAGALGGICTYFLWGHLYAAVVFILEALFVGFSGVAEYKYDLPSSPALLPGEKGARTPIPLPFGRGLG